MNAEDIKLHQAPFRTKPDHEHTYVKIGEFRKYDIKVCKVQGPHAPGKKSDRAVVCGKQIFVLRRRVRGKRASIIMQRPDIIVPLSIKDVKQRHEYVAVKNGR